MISNWRIANHEDMLELAIRSQRYNRSLTPEWVEANHDPSKPVLMHLEIYMHNEAGHHRVWLVVPGEDDNPGQGREKFMDISATDWDQLQVYVPPEVKVGKSSKVKIARGSK